MLKRLRRSTANRHSRRFSWGNEPLQLAAMKALAQILVIVVFRQSEGQVTRLSDLQNVTGFPQKEALRLVRDLHNARVLTIRADACEASASEICVEGDALHCLRDLLPISARIALS